ncbi:MULTISPECIES: excinuclease ABC subunit UvrC [Aerococcus]|uniref:excinuclease ABC subunit UvrC n=1 Tax=Aerococcus TaxID=1375 RepID=UPI00227C8C73|nr:MULTISPECIES: excinuclease ABC subunit UvrC [Aerococcus]MCY3036783.1 excinuclease ABC subunit UvrC [Aerococcus sp. Group 2]MCY3040144.1 excinuclease ABC subunit UvrC [Aerococcus sp. Group 2]MCY3041693.1 excinuclease ABC subunit UvrC [Aerococcus sp. Group 2]MCY3043537.1 excinuclease ABC subunit UvrC [Aerococcus sp. Group 2]MDK6521235.1 excinuclease ABC subunit UvrC [Aerococcus urinae]
MANQLIENKLKLVPKKPGCYIMKDRNQHIIYIGKAKNLFNRVHSYFRSQHSGKTAQLVSEIADFEVIMTNTNKESLLLEINLIKKYKPHYNIMLKYGTMYPYLKITNEEDPQLIITSDVKKDGGKYFGPYPNVNAATSTRDLLQKTYPLRKCGKNEKRACFYYHLGQCIGCCDHEVSAQEYAQQIKRITRFLNGDVQTIKEDLQNKMVQASENMHYERAAEYRDQINYIEQTVEPQNVMSKQYNNRDVFAYYYNHGWISIQVFLLRQFSIIKRDSALFACYNDPAEELTSYIVQFYQEQNHTLPKEVLVPENIDTHLLSDALEISVVNPKRGDKRHMLDLATENAQLAHEQKFRLLEMNEKKTRGAVEELSAALNLPYLRRMESFDFSNISGVDNVCGMVVYEDGRPNKKAYRKFKIKSFQGANEYQATQEVIRRRYSRLLKEGKDLPDIVLMDGGSIEVNAARDVLVNELGLNDLPVAGMVKDDKHRTSHLIYGDDHAIVPLDPKSQAFHLVQRIQIEVDRYAKTFHRQVHHKNSFQSRLDSVKGVGPKTRRKVLSHFKTIKAIRQADLSEIQGLGIPEQVAESIHRLAWEGHKGSPYSDQDKSS